MRKLILWIFILNPCFIFSQTETKYDIYSQIIKNYFIKDFNLIAVEGLTSMGMVNVDKLEYKYFKQNLKELKYTTFINFKNENKNRDTIKCKFSKDLKVIILSSLAIDSVFKVEHHLDNMLILNPWEYFYEKYGKTQGLMGFSKIGYNEEFNQALLYFGNQSGGDAGFGYYVLLIKENDIWTEKASLMAWFS